MTPEKLKQCIKIEEQLRNLNCERRLFSGGIFHVKITTESGSFIREEKVYITGDKPTIFTEAVVKHIENLDSEIERLTNIFSEM